jgi:D-alanyl-D-alanine carboxypeptidase/D-alanyl-D-alanine-endopeptidase (penicillin-binding protein 4)
MRFFPTRAPLPAAICALVLVLSLPAGPALAQTATPAARALSSMQKTLSGDLRRAGGQSSALVVDLAGGKTLFSAAPNTGRLPASVQKLYTTTTALLEFGAGARLSTNVYGVGRLEAGGVWKGSLYLRGGGDPTFGSATFDHAAYNTGATVQMLASRVAHAGIRSLSGRIVGDESLFDSLRGTPATGYKPDLEVEGELSALAYDGGFESIYEDSLQPRPALFATQQFAQALRADHVKVPASTPVYTGVTPPGARQLAYVHSPTIATLMQLTNAPSDNFFAETLLKDIGARFGGGGTTAGGVGVVRSVIARHFGLDPVFDDGSGLSRYDHTTAAQVVSLLRQLDTNQPFVDSLAVAGVSGTMRYEMVGTRGADNCRGKTGTLHDVASLVGYCRAAGGDQLVFAFLMNGLTNPEAGHAIEDQMGEALANYDPLTGQG